MLARASARRRLARSIAHLDDRMLADAGLAPEHRGLGDGLIRGFAAMSLNAHIRERVAAATRTRLRNSRRAISSGGLTCWNE